MDAQNTSQNAKGPFGGVLARQCLVDLRRDQLFLGNERIGRRWKEREENDSKQKRMYWDNCIPTVSF